MKSQSNQKGIVKELFRYAKPYMHFFVFTLIFSIINVIATLYVPVLIGRAVDFIVGKGNVDFSSVKSAMQEILVFVAIAAVSAFFMNICSNKLTYLTVNDIRVKAFSKIEKIPVSYVDKHSQGDIISRIVTDVDLISDGLLMGFTQLFSGVITILATIGFMLSISVKISLIVILITPISLFVASFIAKKTFKSFKEQSVKRGEMTNQINDMLSGQKTVLSYRYEDTAEEEFEKINKELRSISTKAVFSSSLTNPSTRFVNNLVYMGVGIFGAISALDGNITIGQLTAFLTYSNQYTKPFNEISSVVTELQSALVSAGRVFDIISEQEEPSDKDLKTLERVDGTIDINNVNFSYVKEKPLIKNFNLSVKSGQQIAIVGPTGCGKTTLINLLMRFYDVDSGEIKISGENINAITRNSLRRSFGMVLQETWLSRGTIKENIAYGDPNATDEMIINAAKEASAHSFIMQLPQGYDTIVSDDSENISGGQKQLLCIARVMLSRPKMLILDEATSSIDTRTEIVIQRAFKKLMDGRTSIVVAHRLSTIKNADKILVMKDGNVIEQGTHNELYSDNDSFYHKLYHSQFEVAN